MSTKKLRIIIGGLERGGTERHLLYILPGLVKQHDWQVKILLLSNNAELAPEFEKHGIKVIRPKFIFNNKLFKLLSAGFNILRDLLIDRSSITHFYLPEAYLIGMPICKLFNPNGIKIMSRRSLNNYQLKHPRLAKFEHNLHKFTDIIMTNSTAAIYQLNTEEGVEKSKLKLVHNGITVPDINFVENKIKKSYKTMVDFVIIANLIPYKGHADLLRAFKLAKDDLEKPWRLHIIGNDSANIKNDLVKLSIDCGIFNNIIWHGKLNNPGKILQTADVGMLVSHEEGFSNAILEKMAYGLPMIVTDVGGNSEAVVDKVCGYVVPARDINKLAEAIVALGNDEKLRFSMGEVARDRVIERFNIDSCVEAYDYIYSGLLQK